MYKTYPTCIRLTRLVHTCLTRNICKCRYTYTYTYRYAYRYTYNRDMNRYIPHMHTIDATHSYALHSQVSDERLIRLIHVLCTHYIQM